MMQHKTITAKIFISILAFGIIVWIGGTIVRNAIAFDLFVPGTELELKNWYSEEVQLTTVSLFRIAGFYTIIGFCMTFASSVFLCYYFRKYLKTKGWLFMAFVLIFIASPMEFYLMYYDIKIILAFNNQLVNSFNDKIVQDYFLARYSELTIPATMSFLASIAAVFMVIWRPLDKDLNTIPNDNKSEND